MSSTASFTVYGNTWADLNSEARQILSQLDTEGLWAWEMHAEPDVVMQAAGDHHPTINGWKADVTAQHDPRIAPPPRSWPLAEDRPSA